MKKRLYKVEEDKKICGVCGGIAEYFNIDPVILRVLWGVLSIVYGVGIILYFVFAIALPKKSEINIETEKVEEDKKQ